MTDNCKELHFVKDDEAGDSDSGRGRLLSRTGDDKQLRFVKDREARTVDSGQERQLSGAVEGEQLHFVKDDILDKLNQLYEKSAIKEIRFVVGHTLEREKAQENASAEKKVMLKKRDKEMIAECTDAMADRELADILKRVMQVEISRRRQRENSKAR